MKVTLAAVADYASISQGDKLNVIGVFDTIWASIFPARHPSMVFAFRLGFEYADSGQQNDLVVELVNEDGGKSLSLEAVIKAPKVEPGMFHHRNQIVALQDVVFPRPGQYTFKIRINRDEPFEYPLRVRQTGPPGEAP